MCADTILEIFAVVEIKGSWYYWPDLLIVIIVYIRSVTVNVDLNDGFEWTVIIVPDTLVYHAPIKWSEPMLECI